LNPSPFSNENENENEIENEKESENEKILKALKQYRQDTETVTTGSGYDEGLKTTLYRRDTVTVTQQGLGLTKAKKFESQKSKKRVQKSKKKVQKSNSAADTFLYGG
jgi:uncharacterized membrane protein YgaE (UPF0421/DUF939 family)